MAEINKNSSNEELTQSVEASFDAQQIAEDIDSGEKESPKVNSDSDYERSKQYDRPTEAGNSEAGVQSGNKSN